MLAGILITILIILFIVQVKAYARKMALLCEDEDKSIYDKETKDDENHN